MGFSSKLKLVCLVFLAAAACDMPNGKVAQGQLYMSGEQRYDAYFRDVHAIQVWAAQWPDDKKQTRRPLLAILDLTPDAPDVTIVQATHEKVSYLLKEGGSAKLETFVDDAHVTTTGPVHADPSLFHAIEETADGELERAKKMNAMLPKIDELSKLGQSLEPHVTETFSKRSPGKATEVKGELQASITVLAQTTTKARKTIRECDDFVADLQRAVGAVAEHRERKDETLPKTDKPEKPEKPEKTDKPEKPEKPEKPVAKPPKRDTPPPAKPTPVAKSDAPKPPPPPPKPPKQDGEVFNP